MQNFILYVLVLPSGRSVSKAFSAYAEHVMLLYLQNSFADSSNISLNTSARPKNVSLQMEFVHVEHN